MDTKASDSPYPAPFLPQGFHGQDDLRRRRQSITPEIHRCSPRVISATLDLYPKPSHAGDGGDDSDLDPFSLPRNSP